MLSVTIVQSFFALKKVAQKVRFKALRYYLSSYAEGLRKTANKFGLNCLSLDREWKWGLQECEVYLAYRKK
jgi:hypothetical protein